MSAAPRPLSRRDSRKRDKRAAIIGAATDAFMKNGYASMSMSGLIDTLGGSKATLWSYFASKEDLFAAVLEDAVGAYGRALVERLLLSDDLRDGLVTFTKDIIGKMLSDEGLALFRLIAAESGRFPEIGKLFYNQGPAMVEVSLAAYLRRHMDDGALIQDDPAGMAQILIGLCHGYQMRRVWGVQMLTDAQIQAEASKVVEVFLSAYGVVGRP
jgi:AcrR family transcriptional regulator